MKNPLIYLLSSFIAVFSAHAATIGYWRFEDGNFLADSSGNGNSLTLVDNPSQVATPFTDPVPQNGLGNGDAASLDGTDGFWATSTADSQGTGRTAFTFEVFANISSSSDSFLASEWGSNNNRSWTFEREGGQLKTVIEFPGSNNDTNSYLHDLGDIDSIALNANYYLALSYSGGVTPSLTFYAKNLDTDGPLQSSTVSIASAFSSLETASAGLSLGFLGQGGGTAFTTGMIDEVRLSDTVLSESDLLVIPEPTSLLLLISGLVCGVVFLRRRS